MRFKKHVSSEQRALLRAQLMQYKKEISLTDDEIRELETWVSNGHSPYENPDFVCYEGGYLMDYISALRFLQEEYLEYLKETE